MSSISGVGVNQTLPTIVNDALQTDNTAEVQALATLYALSFAGGDTAAAIGLTSPKNFGDVEAILAEISAKLDLTKAKSETTATLSEVEKARSDTIQQTRVINDLASNLASQAELADEITGFDFGSLQFTVASAQLTSVTALVIAATGNSVSNLNKALEKRDDTLQDPVAAKGTEEKPETENVIEDSVEVPTEQEEMLREQERIRDRLIEAGLNAEAANRVAGIGAALTGGIANVLATIERLTGDAALFAQATGAPQGNDRIKVTI